MIFAEYYAEILQRAGSLLWESLPAICSCNMWLLTSFRVPRWKRRASCDLWRGAWQALGDHSWWTCADGSRAYCCAFCCGAGMFFSSLYVFFQFFAQIAAAKLSIFLLLAVIERQKMWRYVIFL